MVAPSGLVRQEPTWQCSREVVRVGRRADVAKPSPCARLVILLGGNFHVAHRRSRENLFRGAHRRGSQFRGRGGAGIVSVQPGVAVRSHTRPGRAGGGSVRRLLKRSPARSSPSQRSKPGYQRSTDTTYHVVTGLPMANVHSSPACWARIFAPSGQPEPSKAVMLTLFAPCKFRSTIFPVTGSMSDGEPP